MPKPKGVARFIDLMLLRAQAEGSGRAPTRSRGGLRVLITGPQGFEHTVVLALDDDPAVITERVRETMEE